MRGLAALLMPLVLGACAEVFPVGPVPVMGEASDQAFVLVVRAPAERYAPGEQIEVFAELIYQGPKNRETVYHAASPIGWQIVQLDGPAAMDGAMAQPCLSTDLPAGVVTRYDFQKGGEIDPGGPFDARWFREPGLTLPPGHWRILATLNVALTDCGGESHVLETGVDLIVGP